MNSGFVAEISSLLRTKAQEQGFVHVVYTPDEDPQWSAWVYLDLAQARATMGGGTVFERVPLDRLGEFVNALLSEGLGV